MTTRSAASRRPRVVIVGAGFGGLSAAKALGRAPVEVTVIDRHNYHLFQPLLYQVATAALSPADIAAPIRSVLRHQKNTSVMLAKVTGVDIVRQEVVLDDRRVPFDYLILATGARHAYFGHDDWELHAHGPQEDRRRDVPAPQDPAGVRARRDRERPRRARGVC